MRSRGPAWRARTPTRRIFLGADGTTFELARAAALHAIELEPELAEGGTKFFGYDVPRMGMARRLCI